MNRRLFLLRLSAIIPFINACRNSSSGKEFIQTNDKPSSQPDLLSKNILRKYHGFNLLNYFTIHRKEPFQKEDFSLIHELGFNYVRLPMDYRCWTDEKSLYNVRKKIYGR
jgi:endoglucanase